MHDLIEAVSSLRRHPVACILSTFDFLSLYLCLCRAVSDPCADDVHNCHPNAECDGSQGAAVCTCLAGYAGDGIECEGMNAWLRCHLILSASSFWSCEYMSVLHQSSAVMLAVMSCFDALRKGNVFIFIWHIQVFFPTLQTFLKLPCGVDYPQSLPPCPVLFFHSRTKVFMWLIKFLFL